MVEEARQEVFFWETDLWVMSNKSSSQSSGQGGCEERSSSDKKTTEPNVGTNQIHEMKQAKMEDPSGSSSGDQEAAVANIVTGKNADAIKMENEDDVKVSQDLSNDDGKGIKVEVSEHDLHIWTERERRKKMKGMFQELHSLIPSLPHKSDKATIVDEAVIFIKTLEQTVRRLEKKKLDRLYGLSSNTPIASPKTPVFSASRESFLADQGSSTTHFGGVSPCGSASFSFPMCSSPSVFQTWASSNVTLNVCGPDAHFSICAPPKPGLSTGICVVLEKHKIEVVSAQIYSDRFKCLFMIHTHAHVDDHFVETFPYEEIYKQAATEIMQWVSSKPT